MRFPLLLQPRWLGLHLVAVLAVLTCAVFGYWQYERAKEPARGEITSPVEDLAAAQRLDRVVTPGAYMPDEKANEAVTATGTYEADKQLLAPALSPEGEKGYYVIVPLVTGGDVAVTVNRGWIPREDADAVDDLPPLPDGEVTVSGWLRPPQKNDDGYIPVSVPKGHVARISASLLVNEWPYQLYEGYVTLAEQRPDISDNSAAASSGQGPALREIPPPDPPQEISWDWRNLSYAAQWEVFGAAVVVFWVSLVRRELRGRADSEGADPSEDGTADTR